VLVDSVGQDHVHEVEIVGTTRFLKELHQFDHKVAAVDEGVPEGCSTFGINLWEDIWDFCLGACLESEFLEHHACYEFVYLRFHAIK